MPLAFNSMQPNANWAINMLNRAMFELNVAINRITGGSGSEAPNPDVESSVVWAIKIANDESHGYSWANRTGPTDYDCSGFVGKAFGWTGVSPVTTHNMISEYTAHGFIWLPGIGNNQNELLRGDILLNEANHTEIYIGNGQNVGAHWCEGSDPYNVQPGDQTGDEISVGGWYSFPWDGVLRYVGGADA